MDWKRVAAAAGVLLLAVSACTTPGRAAAPVKQTGAGGGPVGGSNTDHTGATAGGPGDSGGDTKPGSRPATGPLDSPAWVYTDGKPGCPDWADVTSDMLILYAATEHSMLAYSESGALVAGCVINFTRPPSGNRPFARYGQANLDNPALLAVYDTSGSDFDQWSVLDAVHGTITESGLPVPQVENGTSVFHAPVVDWVGGQPATGRVVSAPEAADVPIVPAAGGIGLPLLNCNINLVEADGNTGVIVSAGRRVDSSGSSVTGTLPAVRPDGRAVGYTYLWAWDQPSRSSEPQHLTIAKRHESAPGPCQVQQVFTYVFPAREGGRLGLSGDRYLPEPVLVIENGDTLPATLLMVDGDVQYSGDEPEFSGLWTVPLAGSTGWPQADLVVEDIGVEVGCGGEVTVVHWPGW